MSILINKLIKFVYEIMLQESLLQQKKQYDKLIVVQEDDADKIFLNII